MVIDLLIKEQEKYNQRKNKQIELILNPPLIKQNPVGIYNLMLKIMRRK